MQRSVRYWLWWLLVLVIPAAGLAQQPNPEDDPVKKFGDFSKVVRGAKVHEGLFTLHQKDENVFMEIRPEQLDRPLLVPAAIARGAGMGGHTLNFDEQWVMLFRRVGDRVHLIRRNVRFTAKPGLPVAKAVETTYTDSVVMALRIHAINPMKSSVVINLNEIFFTDFAQTGMGPIDPSRTSWAKIKAFPKNIELQVAVTFAGSGRRGRFGGGDDVIDSRGNTVHIHYGLVAMPDPGYQPRVADDRIGYFLTALKDFSSDNKDTAFVRYINRWRLERADGSSWKEGGKLVPPKKKIVFWIEKSVPDEYRSAVRDGILEWNKAFEKIGFRDAVEVRQQEDDASGDFDPEDIRYCTFRWIASDQGFAMGPSRANPLTGEILDADIIFDASMVRFYKIDHTMTRTARGWAEPSSDIQAFKRGDFLARPEVMMPGAGWNATPEKVAALPPEDKLRLYFKTLQNGLCQCASHKRNELSAAAFATLARFPGEKVPEELIFQAVKETTMHEVGHTLGLRHNFKASTMLKNDQLHDVALTRKQGLVGSVMDYNPVNLAPKGIKQGDYFTTTIGPYDYWAIEYGYKPVGGGTEGELAELQKIATRSAAAGLDYGTDEDLMTADPHINQWDLGADVLKFAQDRVRLAQEIANGLAERVVENGEGYQRARQAFSLMLRQYGNAATLSAQYVAGEHINRDHRGDANARDPMVPVKGAKQREALKFLSEQILTDKPFTFSPELLRKLAPDRWLHWGNEMALMSGVDYPLNERVLRIHATALDQLLSPAVLNRMQNLASKADKDDQPLQVAEVFRCLTDCVFADLPLSSDKAGAAKSTIIRRNLQREYLQRLTDLVVGSKSSGGGIVLMGGMIIIGGGGDAPPDAKSLSRMHLREISKRIDLALNDRKSPLDDTTRAHLEETKERIAKALNASMQISE